MSKDEEAKYHYFDLKETRLVLAWGPPSTETWLEKLQVNAMQYHCSNKPAHWETLAKHFREIL